MAKKMTIEEYSEQQHKAEVDTLLMLGFKKAREWSYLMEINKDIDGPNLAIVIIPYFEDGFPIAETYHLKIINSWRMSEIYFSNGYDSFEELQQDILKE